MCSSTDAKVTFTVRWDHTPLLLFRVELDPSRLLEIPSHQKNFNTASVGGLLPSDKHAYIHYGTWQSWQGVCGASQLINLAMNPRQGSGQHYVFSCASTVFSLPLVSACWQHSFASCLVGYCFFVVPPSVNWSGQWLTHLYKVMYSQMSLYASKSM